MEDASLHAAGAGCTGSGSAPAYSHQAGGPFPFQGRRDLACSLLFDEDITAGGTGTAQDYYGVDQTWYAGGLDAPQSSIWPAAFRLTTISSKHPTIPQWFGRTRLHNFRQLRVRQPGDFKFFPATTTAAGYSWGLSAPIVLAMQPAQSLRTCTFTGWSTSQDVSVKPYRSLGYCSGGVWGAGIIDGTEINGDDSTSGGLGGLNHIFAGGVPIAARYGSARYHGGWNGCVEMIPDGNTLRAMTMSSTTSSKMVRTAPEITRM